MKLLLFIAVFSITVASLAQPVVSPEVQADGRVTFRLKAPAATNVLLFLEGVRGTNMVKDPRGVWSVTTEPMQPDLYTYWITVDGLRMTDPNNPLLKYNLLTSESVAHVPGPATLPWEINDVPHGLLHRHLYHSRIAGDDREFIVYTPPGYDPTSRKKYPVLYLLHGLSDDPTVWTSAGRANVILDNFIARGQAKPMIVVMPLGYGTMEILTNRSATVMKRNLELFRDELLNEVMPSVEKSYRTLTDRRSRAIAGLSMGGAESLFVGLNTLDRFAWVGEFSSGGLSTDFPSVFPTLDEKANRQLQLLWMSCGTNDGLLALNRNLDRWLTSKGIRHSWTEMPGAHSFRVWRKSFVEFAPLLFQPNPAQRR